MTPKTIGIRERRVGKLTLSPVHRKTRKTLKKGVSAFTVCVRETGIKPYDVYVKNFEHIIAKDNGIIYRTICFISELRE